MKVSILNSEGRDWNSIKNKEVQLFYVGRLQSLDLKSILIFFNNNSLDDFIQYANTLDGNFAFVIHAKDCCILVTDRIRSIPIYYTYSNNSWFVGTDASSVIDFLGSNSIDQNSIISLSMSGYTIGNNTIYDQLDAQSAGQISVLYPKNKKEVYQYYVYSPQSSNSTNYLEYRTKLKDITLKIIKKLILSAKNRQIVVPLSAGNDSRLIASSLKHLGYKNVKCYSYGFHGDYEAVTSRKIAKKLGYDWMFVPLKTKKEYSFYKSSEYRQYLKFADTMSSVQVTRWLTTVKYLHESGWIDHDAIFVNGNSGDFISGGHIPASLTTHLNCRDSNDCIDKLLNIFIDKHFSLWKELETDYNRKSLKLNLSKEIFKNFNQNLTPDNIYAAYEMLEFFHRQTKYVVTTQRIYEFYGYEWRLPLWENEYLDFWEKVPLEMKKEQRLYVDMLGYYNWGGVWNIPVNKLNIRPLWVVPFRFLLKGFLVLLGREKKDWKELDKRLFQYWMDNGMVTKAYPLKDFIFSNGRKNIVSIASQRYVKNKIHPNDY